MIHRLLNTILGERSAQRRADLYRNLIRHEARIGGQVFGAVPKGHRREFFCLDEHTWVWHEEWTDSHGQQRVQTTRYDIRPDGVIKSQGGQYHRVSKQEAQRLRKAAHTYVERVMQELYATVA